MFCCFAILKCETNIAPASKPTRSSLRRSAPRWTSTSMWASGSWTRVSRSWVAPPISRGSGEHDRGGRGGMTSRTKCCGCPLVHIGLLYFPLCWRHVFLPPTVSVAVTGGNGISTGRAGVWVSSLRVELAGSVYTHNWGRWALPLELIAWNTCYNIARDNNKFSVDAYQ